MASRSYRMKPSYQTPRLEDNAVVGYYPQTASDNPIPPRASGHPLQIHLPPPPPYWVPILPYQKATGYNPSKLNDIEPENHEHGYIIKDDSTKPPEIDQRDSSIFTTKTTLGMRNGDNTSYSDLGVEDVGEQIIEDET